MTSRPPLPPWAPAFYSFPAIAAGVTLVEATGRSHRGRSVSFQWDGVNRRWIAILTFAPPGGIILGSSLFGVDASIIASCIPDLETKTETKKTKIGNQENQESGG